MHRVRAVTQFIAGLCALYFPQARTGKAREGAKRFAKLIRWGVPGFLRRNLARGFCLGENSVYARDRASSLPDTKESRGHRTAVAHTPESVKTMLDRMFEALKRSTQAHSSVKTGSG
jgi:hypothetical protein